ncbi:flagellar hook-length control protein FliK [Sphingomonas sp. CJ99]
MGLEPMPNLLPSFVANPASPAAGGMPASVSGDQGREFAGVIERLVRQSPFVIRNNAASVAIPAIAAGRQDFAATGNDLPLAMAAAPDWALQAPSPVQPIAIAEASLDDAPDQLDRAVEEASEPAATDTNASLPDEAVAVTRELPTASMQALPLPPQPLSLPTPATRDAAANTTDTALPDAVTGPSSDPASAPQPLAFPARPGQLDTPPASVPLPAFVPQDVAANGEGPKPMAITADAADSTGGSVLRPATEPVAAPAPRRQEPTARVPVPLSTGAMPTVAAGSAPMRGPRLPSLPVVSAAAAENANPEPAQPLPAPAVLRVDGSIAPAAALFADRIAAAVQDHALRRTAVLPATGIDTASILAPAVDPSATPATPVVAPAAPALDLDAREWMTSMIDRIETLRSEGRQEIRIRLTPDALGAVDIRLVERDGETEVRISADHAAARATLAEAAPKLAELAEARGLRLSAQMQDGDRHSHGRPPNPSPQTQPVRPAPAQSSVLAEAEARPDDRIA